ncbi:unnamed protein product [Discosporangium mesarthrocarpum]
MLTELGKDLYEFARPNGVTVKYNLDTLVDYLVSTGDFTEPLTRLQFTDKALQDIDAKVVAAGIKKPSVLEAKQHPERYAGQKFQQEALVGLERMTSELVTGMLRVVEEFEREEGEVHLVAELFPPFLDLFKQIKSADEEFARQCMQHYISWLEGPPNNPTEDEVRTSCSRASHAPAMPLPCWGTWPRLCSAIDVRCLPPPLFFARGAAVLHRALSRALLAVVYSFNPQGLQ